MGIGLTKEAFNNYVGDITNEQITSKCLEMVKRVNTKKVTKKNAFDVDLASTLLTLAQRKLAAKDVEHASTNLPEESTTGFQIKTTTLEATCKVYSLQIDALKSNVQQAVNTAKQGKKKQTKAAAAAEEEKDSDDSDDEGKAKQKKANKKKELERMVAADDLEISTPRVKTKALRGSGLVPNPIQEADRRMDYLLMSYFKKNIADNAAIYNENLPYQDTRRIDPAVKEVGFPFSPVSL